MNYYDLQSAVQFSCHHSWRNLNTELCPCWWWLLDSFTWYQRENVTWNAWFAMHFWSWEISSLSILCYKNRLFFSIPLERFSAFNLITHLFCCCRASWMKEKMRMWSKHMYDTPEWATTEEKKVLKLLFVRNLLVAWSCVNCMTTLSASGQTSIYLLFICCVQKFIKSFTKKKSWKLSQSSLNKFALSCTAARLDKINWQFRYANFPLNFVTNACIKMPFWKELPLQLLTSPNKLLIFIEALRQ